MHSNHTQSGSSLVVVLVVMVAAAGLSALMYQTAERDTNNTLDLALSTNRFYAAETALEAARGVMKDACEKSRTTCPEGIGKPSDPYQVRFVEAPSDPKACKVTVTISPEVSETGGDRSIQRKMTIDSMKCQLDGPPPITWKAGVTACSMASMSGSSTLSFDSSSHSGTEPSGSNIIILNDNGYMTKTGSGTINGDVYAPGDVSMTGSGKIKGDVYLGGTVSLSGSAEIIGSTHTVTPASLVGVCDPFGVDNMIETARPAGSNMGDFKMSGSQGQTWTPGTRYYNNFTISDSGNLNLPKVGEDGQYLLFVAGNFKMSGSGKLILGQGVTLTIYHAGADIQISGSGSVNPLDDYGKLMIFSSAATMSFTGSSDLAAAVYAPKASVKLAGSVGFYGACHANEFQITGSGNVYFDRSLANNDQSPKINIVTEGWSETFTN